MKIYKIAELSLFDDLTDEEKIKTLNALDVINDWQKRPESAAGFNDILEMPSKVKDLIKWDGCKLWRGDENGRYRDGDVDYDIVSFSKSQRYANFWARFNNSIILTEKNVRSYSFAIDTNKLLKNFISHNQKNMINFVKNTDNRFNFDALSFMDIGNDEDEIIFFNAIIGV
jgi:hypothetical protein